MKTRNYVKMLVTCGVVLALFSSVMAQEVKQGTARVVRIKGAARYSTGNNIWLELKVGMELKPGAIIQTAADSSVDVWLLEGAGGAGGVPAGGVGGPSAAGRMNYYQVVSDQNVVHMTQDSVLAINKLTTTQTGADVVSETELDLRAGRIFGSVKKLPGASKFEVKIPNGVAGVRGTVYSISADGVITVISGAVVVAYAKPDGTVVTQEVKAGYQYDIRTGQLTPVTGAFSKTVTDAVQEASVGPSPRVPMENADYNRIHFIYYVTPPSERAPISPTSPD